MKYEEYFKDSVYYKYALDHLNEKYTIQMEELQAAGKLEDLLYGASKAGKDEYDVQMKPILNRSGLTPKQLNTESSIAIDHAIKTIIDYLDITFLEIKK